MKKAVLVLGAIALAGAAAWFLSQRMLQPGPPANKLLVSGNIEAHESLVSFKAVQSRIVDLPFDEGQWVEAGTVLARLDAKDYRKQVEVNEAALGVAQSQLASALQKADVAHATVLADRADLDQRQLDYERRRKLFASQVVSAETRDLALTALKRSRAVLQRDVAAERAAQKDVNVARANVKDAEQTLDLSRIILGYTVLRAPFSGMILVRNAELGEVMQPGTPVVTLADLNHVWLRAYISETDLGKVGWGQAAVITTDTYPGKKYRGHISFIASQAEFTPKSVETHQERVTLVYRIKIDVENPRHELKPGMPADALIDLRQRGGPQSEGKAAPGNMEHGG